MPSPELSRRLSIPWSAILLVVFLVAQGLVSRGMAGAGHGQRALPPPVGETALRLQALGDSQFAFRTRALQLQHVGSLDGRLVPYRAYDYDRLTTWMRQLDRLDDEAEIMPTLAAFLFSRFTGANDALGHLDPVERDQMRRLVDYLADHARRRPETKWRWLAQAVHLAHYRVGDRDLALSLAGELAALPTVPDWARQMQVFVLSDLGEVDAARTLLVQMRDHSDLPLHERVWIDWYLQTYLGPQGDRR